MKRFAIWLLCLSGLFLACQHDDVPQGAPQLVVEGWIDHGGPPVVMVSTTYPISERRTQLDELQDAMVRWARVAVSDGEDEVVLTGRPDKRYFPPYVYSTTEMRGRAGRTYRLTVDYHHYHAEAQTTVPEPVRLDSLRVLPTDLDTLYQLRAWFRDNPAERNRYVYFVSMGYLSPMWLSSYMHTVDDTLLQPGDDEVSLPIFAGRSIMRRIHYVPYFLLTDTVCVKFAQVDSLSFQYWKDMENAQTVGSSPINTARRNLPSNVSGALGYWCGFGASYWPVTIADSVKAWP